MYTSNEVRAQSACNHNLGGVEAVVDENPDLCDSEVSKTPVKDPYPNRKANIKLVTDYAY